MWNLITSVFAFSSTPESMFGVYLLYYFRVFELQIGSNKYFVFILFSVMVSFLFEVMALAILNDPTANLLTSGPYGLIFASFIPFYFDIPVSTLFRIFGVRFSNKSFIYLAGVQFPEFITSFFAWLSWPSMGNPPTIPARNLAGNVSSSTTRQVKRIYPSTAAPSVVEPPEDSIATLLSMGFDRNSARQALMHARNDINAATNILLESRSP